MSGFFNSLKNFASGAGNATSSGSKYPEEEGEDTRMRFSLIPQPGESGFAQWLDAMKMVAKLQGGIPPEFRKRLWLTLAERHLAERGVDWKQAEKICFNEWSNPDDDELGIQIVKDLHRTGCSLFCGAAGRDNQAVLRRVLLGFARWNKSVGYCQGLNVLAALILQVVDRAESSAVKVMIYLVEGVLPEAYFADNLRGLSIDMAVFRDLLRVRLPKLSRHLEALQSDTKDKNIGSNYEPPLTNVFTMQWFLTLFCHCLPQEAVLRVWDLIFLEGDEVLLRTALAIWEGLSDRIMPVNSADEFYSIMGVLTREMLEFTDTNYLIKRIVNMGPLYGVTSLREKHRYNITPWARRLSDDDETDTEDDDRLAVEAANAMINMSQKFKKDRSSSPMGALLPSSDRERLALDISSLKQQYAKLRERQRQAHIILSAACARQTMVPSPSSPAMNHLLVGKTALVSAKARQIGPPHRLSSTSKVKPPPAASKLPVREEKQGITLHWKDMKKPKDSAASAPDVKKRPSLAPDQSPDDGVPELRTDSDSDSTSTELCDEPDRLSDLDSGEPSSTSECGPDKWSPGTSPTPSRNLPEEEPPSSEFQDIADRIGQLSSRNEGVVDVGTEGGQLEREAEVGRTEEEEFGGGEEVVERGVEEERTGLDQGGKVPEVGTREEVEAEGERGRGSLEGEKGSGVVEFEYVKDLGLGEELEKVSEEVSGGNWEEGVSVSPTESKIYFEAEEEKVKVVNGASPEVSGESYVIVQENLGEDSYKIDQTLNSYIDRDFLQRYEETKAKFEEGFLGRHATETKDLDSDFSNKFKYDEHEELVVDSNYERTSLTEPEFTYDFRESKLDLPGNETKNSYKSTTPDTFPKLDLDDEFPLDFKTKNRYDAVSYKEDQSDFGYRKTKIEDFQESKKNADGYLKSDYSFDNYSSATEVSRDSLKEEEDAFQKYSYLDLGTSKEDRSSRTWRFEDYDYKLKSLYKPEEPEKTSGDFSSDKSYSTVNKLMFPEDRASDQKFSLDHSDLRLFTERDKSPKSPESTKSFSSGETMGPDSKVSTITDLSSRTPLGSEVREFYREKSLGSPGSSESKTLTLRSMESDESRLRRKQDQGKANSVDVSSPWTTMSTDSLQNKSDTSPKLVVSASSSESYSPGKLKSSERSFSSDLQSPVSANSINYQANYKGKDGITSDPPSVETIAITSPFYPIAHPNQKTPSPYSIGTKQKSEDTLDPSPKSKFEEELKTSIFGSQVDSYEYKSYKYKPNPEVSKPEEFRYEESEAREKPIRRYVDDMIKDSEEDTLSPLPRESRFEFLHRGRDDRKLLGVVQSGKFERSCSSLDKTLGDLRSSLSSDELGSKNVKKRSSDILEDIRHLEAKSQVGSTDTSSLTKNTGYIWEDVQNLEARRQDTFSDSARSFSKESLNRPTISVSTEMRKTYIVEPKINIDDGSILKSISKDQEEGREDYDDQESKLGVWTKVKPRKKGENGRRSSDRALKIIQENSAILQRILTCQAKKRLPDLEAISKEITISPINEEISKIFSPILEKMGLNEHEINEELARINFKNFDQEVSTCGSEFDAKINDELSKLSIIDDNEEVNHLALDDIIAEDYLNTREALIDKQINEELSKLLANCDSREKTRERIRYFRYKSCDSDTSSVQGSLDYQESVPRYTRDSPKSDIDIYHELEKLDHLQTGHPLPSTSTINIAYDPSVPYTTSQYSPKRDKPLSSPYDSYKIYDYKPKLSPNVSESLAMAPPQKSPHNTSFDFVPRTTVPLDYNPPGLSKETLEFRVRYDSEEPRAGNLAFPNSKTYYHPSDDYSYDSYSRKFDLSPPSRYSYTRSTDYDESDDLLSHLPGTFDSLTRNSRLSSGYKDTAKRPVSHPEFPDTSGLTKYTDAACRDTSAYRTSSLSLDNIGQKPVVNVDTTPSPKAHFSPFPVRNASRKPKELALKLGLYSPTSPTALGPLKRS